MGRVKGEDVADHAPPESPSIYQFPMGEATLTTTESALLGACILSPEALAAAKGLDPEDMYRPHHRALLRLLRRFAQSGKPWDLTLLVEHLSGDPAELEACGGSLAAISGYADEIPSTNFVPAYVEAIQDAATRRKVRQLGSKISEQLSAAASNRTMDISEAVDKARNWLAAALPGHTRSVESEGPEADVWRMLSKTKHGTPRPTLSNLYTILRDDSRWRTLRLNLLGNNIEQDGEPREHEANFIAEGARWLATHYETEAGSQILQSAVLAAAQARAYHPVREYLNGLEWDREPRIHRILTEVLGHRPTELHYIYVRRFIIGSVARAMEPGVKFDTALVLVGKQGAKKSTLFKALYGAGWFGDSPIPIGDKDAFIQLRTVWCYESAEMEDLSRRTAEAIKQFLSGSVDNYRAPYDREARHHPRHSVMVGTTNRPEFLTDETGHRRFWPITVPDDWTIRIDLIKDWRDQIWAEAVAAYRAKETFWLDEEEAKALERDADTEQYQEVDPWRPAVEAALRGTFYPIQTADALTMVVKKVEEQTIGDSRRMAKILRQLKWEQVIRPHPGEHDPKQRVWVHAKFKEREYPKNT